MPEGYRRPIIDRHEVYKRVVATLILPSLAAGGVYYSSKAENIDSNVVPNNISTGEGISLKDQQHQRADQYTITDGMALVSFSRNAREYGLSSEQVGVSEPHLSAIVFSDPNNEFSLPKINPKDLTATTPNNTDFVLPKIITNSNTTDSLPIITVEATPTTVMPKPETAPSNNEDTQRADIVKLMQTELAKNVVEVPRGSNSSPEIDKYTAGMPDSWCASFVSWIMKQTGHTLSGGSRISSKYPDWDIVRVNGGSDNSLVGYFVNKGTYRDIDKGQMKPGDPYFDKVTTTDPKTGNVDVSEHTGVAISSPDPITGNYDGIEGNFSEKVSLVHRSTKTKMAYNNTTERIYGYGSVFAPHAEAALPVAPTAKPALTTAPKPLLPAVSVAGAIAPGDVSSYLSDGLGNGGFFLPVIPESTAPSSPPSVEITKSPVFTTPASPEAAPDMINAMENVPDAYRTLFINAAAAAHIKPELLTAIFVTEHGNRWPNPAGPWATSGSAAYGPWQFLLSTWDAYKIDGDGDGKADIQSVADGAFAAAAYLAANGAKIDAPLGDPTNLQPGTICYAAGTYNAGGGTMQSKAKPGINVDNSGLLPEAKTYIKNVHDLIDSHFIHGVAGYGGGLGTVKSNIPKK